MKSLAERLLAEEAPVIAQNTGDHWKSQDVTNAIIGSVFGELGNASKYDYGSNEDRAFREGIEACARAFRPALEAIPAQSLAAAYNQISGHDKFGGSADGQDGFNLNLPDGDI